MAFRPENKKGSGTARVDPLPCVSPTNTPAIPRPVDLTERSWPFVCSFALHAVLFEILFFPLLPPPTVASSIAPTVLWFSPFVVPGESGHTTSMPNQPEAAVARQTEAAESVPDDRPKDAIENDRPATQLASAQTADAETDGMPFNVDPVVIQSPPNMRSEADLIAFSPVPAPRRIILPSVPLVVPASEPSQKQQQARAAEPSGIVPAEKRQSDREWSERQEEAERFSRELAARKHVLAENARQEQLSRRQAHQSILDQTERERVAAENIRLEQEAREKLQHEQRILEEQGRLAAEKTRQAQRDREQEQQSLLAAERTRQAQKAREQEQQALREQAELKRIAAEKERQAREQLQREQKLQEDRDRLAVERTRQVLKAREQEQQALREQAERIRVAAEKARQERELQEHLLRERKLQEAMLRKEREQTLEQAVRLPLAVAIKKQENPAPKVPENNTGHSPAQQPQKGLSLPLLKGDLKLVVTGVSQPKITITFKEFALTRRNRPFSRVEARREAVITPLIATTQENTREVVIEKVKSGVYAVTVEPGAGSSDFACLLKLHEGTSKMSVRDIGRHTLTQKKVLIKILMPEGILWDDNKSFTGSMEDSDSVTKFNAETGLTWKEYSD